MSSTQAQKEKDATKKDFAQLVDLFEYLTTQPARRRTAAIEDELQYIPDDLHDIVKNIAPNILDRDRAAICTVPRDSGFWESMPQHSSSSASTSSVTEEAPNKYVFTFKMPTKREDLLVWAANVDPVLKDSQERFRPLPQELRPRKWKEQAERKRRLSYGNLKVTTGEPKIPEERLQRTIKKRCIVVSAKSAPEPDDVPYVLHVYRPRRARKLAETKDKAESSTLEELEKNQDFKEGLKKLTWREKRASIRDDDEVDSDDRLI
ncbi:hypothetical protein NEOLEDRAFT_1133870, partial [Neolentinus lepideus HHB14362 ss-1]